MKLIPDHPHAKFLLDVKKPGRYAGSEYGCASIPQDCEVSLVLIFPDVYEIGCSNLGITILYRIASSIPGVRVERAFTPWGDYIEKLKEYNETIRSYETATPLKDFDIIGFSLQHELLYTNVLLTLKLTGIPIRSNDRDGKPLIIAGGPCTSNPEPLSPFIDAFVLGDGEPVLPRILEAVSNAKKRKTFRKELLNSLATIDGIYVPSFYEREKINEKRWFVKGKILGSNAPYPVKYSLFDDINKNSELLPIIPAIEPVFDRYQIEITRGCGWKCRFCHAGIVYKPVRHRSAESVIKEAVEGIFKTGYGSLSFSSLSSADYPYLEYVTGILKPFIESERINLSISSLRSYGLSRSVLEAISSVKATGITLAPEAGTARMRSIIGKQIKNEDLFESLELLLKSGWRRVKLYFMIGLPMESDEDVEGIAETLSECRKKIGTKHLSISASISNFVPKPFTAFERCRINTPQELISKKQKLILRMRRIGATNINIEFHDPYRSFLEGILSRGGLELAEILESAVSSGCYMDNWTEMFKFDSWKIAFENHGLKMEEFAMEIPEDFSLPWSHIQAPVSDEFIRKDYQKAKMGIEPDICFATSRSDSCDGCGADCDLKFFKYDTPPFEFNSFITDRIKKHRSKSLASFGEELPSETRLSLGMGFIRFGRAIYAGHQDIVRIMEHIFRRAGLPMRYSQGFSPKPIINFRCALPLGVIGINEEVFVEIASKPQNTNDLVEILNNCTHPGIEFISSRVIERHTLKQILKNLPSITFFVILPADTKIDDIKSAVASINKREEIKIINQYKSDEDTKEANRYLNIKGMIKNVSIAEKTSSKFFDDNDLQGHFLRFETVPQNGHLVKINHIHQILSQYNLTPLWFIRKIE